MPKHIRLAYLGLAALLFANLLLMGKDVTLAAVNATQDFARSRILMEAPFAVEVFVQESGTDSEFAVYVIKWIDPSGKEQFQVWGSANPSNKAGVAFLFPGTTQQNWTELREEFGTAWVFHSEAPVKLVVPFGTLQTDRGILRGGDEITTMGATWRPRNPDFKPVATTTAAIKVPPTPPTNAVDDPCMTGIALAEKMGWSHDMPQGNTATYGGAVVGVPAGAELPPGWTFVGDGRPFNQGGVFSIYPPSGRCRARLGVSS